MKAVDVLRLVSGALQDLETGIDPRWKWEGGQADMVGLLDFLNAAVQAVAMQRPDATAITESILLEPGMRQRIPEAKRHRATANALILVELVRNMGADGETPGAPITPVRPDILLAWGRHQITSKVVDNFGYDKSTNPRVYYVYPCVPEDVDVYVEATYSAEPTQIFSKGECLPISDSYAPAIMHHILASILSGDSEASNMAKAQYHMQMFQSVLGIKAQVDAAWPKGSTSLRGGL